MVFVGRGANSPWCDRPESKDVNESEICFAEDEENGRIL